jgi:hypothetical protein
MKIAPGAIRHGGKQRGNFRGAHAAAAGDHRAEACAPHDRRVDWIDAANHRPTIAPIAFGAQTFLLDRGTCDCAFFRASAGAGVPRLLKGKVLPQSTLSGNGSSNALIPATCD